MVKTIQIRTSLRDDHSQEETKETWRQNVCGLLDGLQEEKKGIT